MVDLIGFTRLNGDFVTLSKPRASLRSGVESERLIDEVQKNGVRLTWNDETEQSLRAAGAPSNRLMDLAKERGVKSRLTPDAERQLPQAGAYEKLMLAVREAAP